jgi:hypothetical protein
MYLVLDARRWLLYYKTVNRDCYHFANQLQYSYQPHSFQAENLPLFLTLFCFIFIIWASRAF